MLLLYLQLILAYATIAVVASSTDCSKAPYSTYLPLKTATAAQGYCRSRFTTSATASTVTATHTVTKGVTITSGMTTTQSQDIGVGITVVTTTIQSTTTVTVAITTKIVPTRTTTTKLPQGTTTVTSYVDYSNVRKRATSSVTSALLKSLESQAPSVVATVCSCIETPISDGVSTKQCPSDTPSACKGSCRDYSTDKFNCGSCGNKCITGQLCSHGSCYQPTPCDPRNPMCRAEDCGCWQTTENISICSNRGDERCGADGPVTACASSDDCDNTSLCLEPFQYCQAGICTEPDGPSPHWLWFVVVHTLSNFAISDQVLFLIIQFVWKATECAVTGSRLKSIRSVRYFQTQNNDVSVRRPISPTKLGIPRHENVCPLETRCLCRTSNRNFLQSTSAGTGVKRHVVLQCLIRPQQGFSVHLAATHARCKLSGSEVKCLLYVLGIEQKGSGSCGRLITQCLLSVVCVLGPFHELRRLNRQLRCPREEPKCSRCTRLGFACFYPEPPNRKLLAASRRNVARKANLQNKRLPEQRLGANLEESTPNIGLVAAPGPAADIYLPVREQIDEILCEAYFSCVFNANLVFHRPTFEQAVTEQSLPQHVILAVYAMSTK
nr:hypothetical protein CFP56_22173 [Quercus suber]